MKKTISLSFLNGKNFSLPRWPAYVGDPIRVSTHVSPHYIGKSAEETECLVAAILADYRGYDTLGKI